MKPKNRPTLSQRVLTFVLSLVLVATSFPAAPLAYADELDGVVTLEPVTGDETFDVDGTISDDVVDGETDDAVIDGADNSEADGTDAPETEGALENDGESEDPNAGIDLQANGNEPANNKSGSVAANKTFTPKNGKLSYTSGGPYALVVKGTFNGDIRVSGGVKLDLTVEKNAVVNGQVNVSGGAKLVIRGAGKIDGQNKVGSVIIVEGAKSELTLKDGIEITGGNGGTLIHADDQIDWDDKLSKDKSYYAGGGVLVQRDADGNAGAKLTVDNAYIHDNKANAGGGIFIDRACGFTMSSGTVSSNTATTHEGGGIYVAGNRAGDGTGTKAEVLGGKIVGNVTETKVDWGGGGIFVESKGVLYLGSSLIKGNTAAGLGGGISGCPHASIGIGRIEEGFSLFGNTAKRESWPDNEYLDSLNVEYNGKKYVAGDKWAKADSGFTADKAMDYYCVNVSYINGYDGLANSTVAWTGRAAGSTAYGTKARDITVYKGDSLVLPGESLGLTGSKPATDTVTGRAVEITGNTSTTHGGGIGCNGTLMVGDLPTGDQYSPLSFEIKKELKNSEGGTVGLTGGEFTFDLVDASGKTVATSKNDEKGAVLFSVSMENVLKTQIAAGKTKDLTYTVRERPGDAGDIEYAKDVTVKLSVKHTVQSISYPNASLNVTYHDPELKKIEVDGKVFDNGEASENPVTLTNTLKLEGSIDLAVRKSAPGLDGRPFTFSLQEVKGDSDLTPVEPAVARTATVVGSGTASFGAIDYTAAGDHWYLVSENVDAADRDVSWDTSRYLVKVSVGAAEDGRSLAASVAEVRRAANGGSSFDAVVGTDVAFTNTALEYAPFELSFDKRVSVNGGEQQLPREGEFSFELRDGDALVAAGTTAADGTVRLTEAGSGLAPLTKEAYLSEGGTKTFDRLTLHEPAMGKSFATTLTLSTTAARNGDDTRLVVTPEVGEFAVKGVENNVVVNELSVSTEQSLSVTKRYVGEHGDEAGEGAFAFVLEEVDADGTPVEGGVSLEARNPALDGNGEAAVTFGPVTYERPGTYRYRVSEKPNDTDHIGRDRRVFVAEIVVTATDGGRKLEAFDPVWFEADGETPVSGAPVFVNHDDVYGPLSLPVRKVFKNNLGEDVSLEGEEFTFELFDREEGGEALARATADPATGVATFSLDGERFVSREGEDREFSLWVAEVDGGRDHVTYDTARRKATFTVSTVESVDGRGATVYTPVMRDLVVGGVAAADGGDTFRNRLDLEASFVPEVTKLLTGAEGVAGAYTFRLQELEGLGDGSAVDLSKVVPGDFVKEGGHTDTASNGAFDGETAPVAFSAIAYDRPGTHWYVVTEDDADTEAVGTDRSALVLKVGVAKAADGKSIAARLEAAYHAAGLDKAGLTELDLAAGALPLFHNAAKEFDEFSFAVTKRLVNAEGATLDLAEGETFSFNVYDSETGGEPLNAEPVANDAEGTVTFTLPSEPYVAGLSEDGTVSLTFWVEEVAGDDDSYTYASGRVPVEVELSVSIHRPSAVDPADTTRYETRATVANQAAAQVTNTFLATGSWSPEAQKVYEGDGEGPFGFTLRTMEAPADLAAVDLRALVGETVETRQVSGSDFVDGRAPVRFSPVTVDAAGDRWYLLSEDAGDDPAVSYDRTVYAIRVSSTLNGRVYTTETEVFRAESMDARTLVPAGVTTPLFVNHDNTYGPLAFSIKKDFENSLGHDLAQTPGEFSFELAREEGGEPVAVAANDADGTVTFVLADGRPYTGEPGTVATHVFYVRETAGDRPGVSYDTAWHRVEVDVATRAETCADGSLSYLPSASAVRLFAGAGGQETVDAVTNTLALEAEVGLRATKTFHGDAAAAEGAFSFTLQGVAAPEGDLAAVVPAELVGDRATAPVTQGPVKDDGVSPLTLAATNGAFTGLDAEVVFPTVTYDREGSFWYLVTEDGAADPCAFVVRVDVAERDGGEALEARVARVYFADSVASTGLTELEGGMGAVGFVNTAPSGVTLASYAVSAASGEPVDQKCLVDPKVHKELDGRPLVGGEFSFQLVQSEPVAEGASDEELYNDRGALVSAAVNDRYGMVDFDKANNLAPAGVDPSCLLFTAPGTYRYVVVEDPGFKHDPSVVYSSERITFTVEVGLDAEGNLCALDQYYGRLVDGANVRCSADTDPGFSADASWHPTITNSARGIDLKVRKTSVLDRDRGLEGATYGLYRVNEVSGGEGSGQADILLGEAVSDADGWIVFEDAPLTEGALYYFRETAAPAGHTVSEFRSAYFSLVRDGAAEGGWGLAYTDVKDGAAPVRVEAEAALAADPREPGNLVLVYDHDGGVSDEPTRVSFTKLDTRTHEWVEGAELSIRLNRDRDRVVASWVSGKAPKDVVATLDVGCEYVLREDRAPEGYAVADDVVFVLDSHGKVTVLSGATNGNAELTDDGTIVLYDTMLDGEEVVTEYRERVRFERGKVEYRLEEGDARRASALPATGDFASGALWYWVPALVAAGVVTAVVARRRRS